MVAPPAARAPSEIFATPDADRVASDPARSTDSDRAAPAPAFPPLAQRTFAPEPLARQSPPLAEPVVESEPLGPTAGMSARAPGPFGRALRAQDEVLVGSNGLIANTLRFGGDLARDSVAVAFSWRALSDASGSMHNTLLMRLSGEPCDDEGPCGLRASGLIGFSPEGRGNFAALIGGAPHSDALDWSSLYFGFGLQARARNGLGFELNGELQSASIDYFEGVDGTPVPHDASLGQLKLAAAGSWTRGGFQLRAYLADNVYVSGDTSASVGAPMQGVFYDSELAGLASGPQGFFGKLEARYLFSNGFALQGGYGFLGYAGPEWASGQVISARFSKELGRFQLALAMAGQFDSLSAPPAGQGTSQATLFFSGSAQAHF